MKYLVLCFGVHYRNGQRVNTTTVDEQAMGGECGLFPGLPNALLKAYYKAETCEIKLEGTG